MSKREELKKLERRINKTLDPYHKQLGSLLQSWNSLQFQLTYLFLSVCETRNGDPLPQDILLAVWNAVPNDRFQRRMLENAAIARFGRHAETMKQIGIDIALIRENEQSMLDEIQWILKKADSLGRQRDEAAHVPTIIHMSDALLEVAPLDALGHPIATQLAGKNLLNVFALQQHRIDTVSEYVRAWEWYLSGHGTLPQRPSWPESPRSSGRKDEKERGNPKQRRPQRKASPA